MKVRAKHNFNNGTYHKGGEIFEVESLDGIEKFVETLGFVSEVFPPEKKEEPVKRGRKKKTEE